MPPETAARLRSRLVVPALAGIGLALIVLFLYLRRDERAPAPGELTSGQLGETYAGLCRVRAEVDSGVDEAGELFFGRVHSPLHVIAAQAGEEDRTAAARMLEAKNDVESAFNESAPEAEVGSRLDRLLSTTAEALRSIGVTPSPCES